MNTLVKTLKKIWGLKHKTNFVPQPQIVLQDEFLTKQLNEKGYAIVNFLSEEKCATLLTVFEQFHAAKSNSDGAFLGIISKNIHDAINVVVLDLLDSWFKNYNTTNAFLLKTPGKNSFVPIHQDIAAIDEKKFSTVNVWIPLQDITSENGVMYVVPYSHHIFSPFRGANIDALTKNIEKELQPYFKPIYLKKGEALFFDSRMFHFSPPNLSSHNRIITVCRIFPKEAKMISYFKEKESNDNKIEIWQCADDYLIYKNGYDDNARPPHATLIGNEYVDSTPLNAEEFDKKRIALGIIPQADAMPAEQYFAGLNQPFFVGFERP
jgi:hypothetical protein